MIVSERRHDILGLTDAQLQAVHACLNYAQAENDAEDRLFWEIDAVLDICDLPNLTATFDP